jgi:uncharacterized protein YjbI with pentapeptide repeats
MNKMTETLKDIMDSYRSGMLSTPNIQVIEKKLFDETIEFPVKVMVDLTFSWSSFRKSDLTNMKFIHVNFEYSYFEKCLFENCLFENTILQEANWDKCVFKNCRFIHCNLRDIIGTEIIFNECTFLESGLDNSIFELCHFLKPIFKSMNLGSSVLIDSKFSNSKKSIEFKGEVYFSYIFDQIQKFQIDEE